MNIHEYQAKSLLAKYGVAVPKGGVAYTPAEAAQVARGLAGPAYVVKSQIHAGGRGAGRFKNDPQGKGGVRVVKGYHAEEREAEVFSKGVVRLLENVFKSLTMMSLMSLSSTVLMGFVSAGVMFVEIGRAHV